MNNESSKTNDQTNNKNHGSIQDLNNSMNDSNDLNKLAQENTILIIEDDFEISDLIGLILSRQGYRILKSESVFDGIAKLKSNAISLIVLDWMLPEQSGVDFLKQYPAENRPPVLMVTAKAEPSDIVMGLEAGADDYITKPFPPSVLVARVKTLLRRAQWLQSKTKETGKDSSEIFQFGLLKMNLLSHQALCEDQEIHLTPSEFKILAEMLAHPGRVLTRDYLIKVVQGDGVNVTGRTIDTHVFGLRKKLGSCSEYIETIRGIGYRVKVEI